MNIGMVLDLDFPPDLRVENEAVCLVKAGYKVFLLCFDYNGNLPAEEEYKGIRLIRIHKSKKNANRGRALINTPFDYYTGFWAKEIIKFVQNNNIEVLHIHDLYLLGAAFKANEKLQLSIIGDLHENYVEGLKHYKFANTFPGNILISKEKWRKKEIEWCNKADKLITVIDEAVERYKSLGIPEEKLNVVANYVNTENFLSAKDDESIINRLSQKFTVIYIGGFDIHRGLESVVRAIPKIMEVIKDFHLILVGRGKNENDLKNIASELNISEHITFEGFQSAEKLPSYIKGSSVCLVPHLKTVHTDNTIPHKLFHYMILEKPVVVSNCNPIERIVKEANSGLIYESNNEFELAEKIIELYKNKNNQKVLGKNGKLAVEEKYNWEVTSKNLISMYQTILEK